MTIDINCDLGEEIVASDGKPVERSIMPLISSANIACGYHAGNKESIQMCVDLAVANKVAIGAHPSYNDKENFGRVFIPMQKRELIQIILEQITILGEITAAKGAKLSHVKAHGALYNAAAKTPEIAEAFTQAVSLYDKNLVMFGLPGSALETAAYEARLSFAAEAFPDRGYSDDGVLADRRLPGALITDPNTVINRAVLMAREKKVQTLLGKWINLKADTLCIHGDNPNAIALLSALKVAFQKENIIIKPVTGKFNPKP